MRRTIALHPLLLLAVLSLPARAVDKKSLTHAVYDGWNRITGDCISGSGAWVAYVLEPQEGDPRLVLLRTAQGTADTIARGSAPRFSYGSRYLAFTIKAPFADIRKGKIAKKKVEDMPKDSLGIITLGTPGITVIPRVKSFQFPEKGEGWIAYQLEKEPPKKDSSKSQPLDTPPDAEEGTKGGKDEKGTTLIVRDLASGAEFRFPWTVEFRFSRSGNRLMVATSGNDSTELPGVFVFDTATRLTDTLVVGRGTYRRLAWDEEGRQAAFVADRDTSKAKQRYFTLMYWTAGSDTARILVDTTTRGFPEGWLVSEHGQTMFSKNGDALFFGTAPVPMPEDTSFNDEETAQLDVWNWRDPYLQTHQLKDLEAEKKRSYLAVVHLGDNRFVQLADTALPAVTTGDEGNAPYALGLSPLPYRQIASWESVEYHDVYVVNVATGAKTMILERHKGSASISPAGRYLFWYDYRQRHWYTCNVATRAIIRASAGISVPLYNELSDIPDDPGPHGVLGWAERDSLLFIYDRYDVWAVDPAGTMPPANLSRGEGRTSTVRFRYVRFDPEERYIPRGAEMFVRGFSEKSKAWGYYVLGTRGGPSPRVILRDTCDLSAPLKAREDSVFLFTRSTFTMFPDLYLATGRFTDARRMSDANPQQKDYLWGTVELVSWKAADGKPIEGLLYKPEHFDPRKKYPMIVYYYERNSDLLHRYVPPAPSRSTINYSYCVSNGYVVFVPDIRYRNGYPGQSAYDCILPGVRRILRMGFVDSTRIALQGQSWGGYQTAFLVTRTPIFRCAFAGAPVSNMTSAYGGIRWESGRVRMFQYETAQSRIGGTLWEKLDLYIENSPLFRAHQVRTPLLIMANDNDGAVPWYQGIELFTALRRLGKPSWMLVYNSEAHNLVQRKNQKDLSIRMMQFFDHFLKDSAMAAWMKDGIPAVHKGKTMGYELVPGAAR